MTKREYKKAIARLIPGTGDIPVKALRLIDKAVGNYPLDAELWQKRAALIQLGPKSVHTLEDALASYFTALYLDPTNADIVQDIGHFFDAVMADTTEGQKWFAKAKRMKTGQQTAAADS